MKLLCLSNGHGEDIIAVQVLEQLQQQDNTVEIFALPIVGEGYAYQKRQIPIVGTVQQMPSGGFIYMDSQQLWRDLQGGLLKLTLRQYQAIRQWAKLIQSQSEQGLILAVGDIVPLIFAWLSGLPYGFIGTAKSEYYLRDEHDWLPQTSTMERWLGGVYLPWERWLMSQPLCRGVFPRDQRTTEVLQQYSIPALNLGNPMMDGLEDTSAEATGLMEFDLKIVILPGSRMPEAIENWQLILQGILGILAQFPSRKILFLVAIASSVSLTSLESSLSAQGWQSSVTPSALAQRDPKALTFQHHHGTICLTQNAYPFCLHQGQVAIAMAGTATEQFVGLGKPAITLVGKGPQFTPAFAEAQTRLLGESIFLLEQPEEIASTLEQLLTDPQRRQQIHDNGKRRMGKSGSAQRIAQALLSLDS